MNYKISISFLLALVRETQKELYRLIATVFAYHIFNFSQTSQRFMRENAKRVISSDSYGIHLLYI